MRVGDQGRSKQKEDHEGKKTNADVDERFHCLYIVGFGFGLYLYDVWFKFMLFDV